MALHIVDSFVDKLISPNENPLLKRFSRLPGLMRDGSSLIPNFPPDIHQALIESNFILSDFEAAMFPTGIKQEQPRETLVSRVHKLYHSPNNFIQDFINEMTFLSDHSCLNRINLLPEVLELPNVMFNKGILHCSPKDTIDFSLGTLSDSITKAMEVAQDIKEVVNLDVPLKGTSQVKSSKPACTNNTTFNEELVNRKAKKLQKRSRKRRRRQKKDDKVKNNCNISFQEIPSQCASSASIFCDIVANVLNLPNSYLVSVDSAEEEDSDWNSISDHDYELLGEFEVTGLFVANLTSAKSGNCIKNEVILHCDTVLGGKEDLEFIQLQNTLRKVNKDWNDSTKELSVEPKIPTKVAFASDSELVQVLPVEVYDRKGEWERYATERLRFQRRIREVEKVVSPCLTQAHRTKVLSRL